MNMNALKMLFFMSLSHMSCVRITDVKNSCESFTKVKDSHVIVTSVKNSHEFFTGVTNTFEFFTLVTYSFDFHIRTNLSRFIFSSLLYGKNVKQWIFQKLL